MDAYNLNEDRRIIDDTKPRGWWQRNWKWAVPSGCLTLAAIASVAVVGLVLMVFGLIKSCGAYEIALERVQEDAAVVERLGRPIEPGWYVTGNVHLSGASGRASMSFPVAGPDGSATVHIEATKTMGQWTAQRLVVEIKGTRERIVLVQP